MAERLPHVPVVIGTARSSRRLDAILPTCTHLLVDATVLRLLVVDQLEAVFNVLAKEIHHIQLGDKVRVDLRSQAEQVEAVVNNISPSIDGQSGTVQVRVLIQNPDGRYRSGDRCTLRISPRSSSDRSAMVPATTEKAANVAEATDAAITRVKPIVKSIPVRPPIVSISPSAQVQRSTRSHQCAFKYVG